MLPILRETPLQFSRPLISFSNYKTLATSSSSSSSSSINSRAKLPPVAVFWDLNNKPPKPTPLHDAAVRLRLAASSLGPLRLVAAYASSPSLRAAPAAAPSLPHACRVCGRNFFAHSKLLDHFKLHEREHAKRLRRIDSATGGRYVRLKAQLSLKMDKYRKAAREVLVPRVGVGIGDELQRAGVSVRVVEDRPDRALREHVRETMERRIVGCLVLVSDDVGFRDVVGEARMRGLRTVVVGDDGDGALKRCADASFSWKDVVSGKARKAAPSAVLRWNDRDLVKRLEWRHEPELGCKDVEDSGDEGVSDLMSKRVLKPWWKLD